MLFLSCEMPALALCAKRSVASPDARRVIPENWLRERCLCSSLQLGRSPPKGWESTRSSSTGTTGMNWEFTRGHFCGSGVPARSARPNGKEQSDQRGAPEGASSFVFISFRMACADEESGSVLAKRSGRFVRFGFTRRPLTALQEREREEREEKIRGCLRPCPF